MKIERLSENQIRCTLNKADLNEKHLKISELAYGTQKARELFRDMIQQASAELGFEIDDTPLMVEAIPVSPDCLILIVTKVEDPEELDTRFSRFSKVNEYDIDDDDDDFDDYDDVYEPDSDYDDDDNDNNDESINTVARIQISGSENVPEEIKKVLEGLLKNIPGIAAASLESSTDTDSNQEKKTATASDTDSTESQKMIQALYSFDSLSTLIRASKQVASFYFSDNCLYKNPVNNRYYLLVSNSSNSANELARVCSIIAEYGVMEDMTYAMPAHFKEHYIPIITEDAVQTLSAL